MAIGAALYERLVYAEDGGFLTGSFADYAVPTASMIPELEILHQESPSPMTPLGAKGVAEGNAMSTPACIANAVADALDVAEISLPLIPERMLESLKRGSTDPTHRVSRR
jgi:2-furoyl-CoA dehydrogenase large subunit